MKQLHQFKNDTFKVMDDGCSHNNTQTDNSNL